MEGISMWLQGFFPLIRWQGKELRKSPIIPTVIKHWGNLCVTSPCVYWGWIVFTGMRERALVWGESKISTLESSLTIFRIAGSLLQISPSTPFFFPQSSFNYISHHLSSSPYSLCIWVVWFQITVWPRERKKNVCKPQKEPFRVVTKDKTVTSETEAIVTIRHRLHRFKSICSKRFWFFFFLSHISKQVWDFLCSSRMTARFHVNAALQHRSHPAAPPDLEAGSWCFPLYPS